MPSRSGRTLRDEFMLLVQRTAALVRRETNRRMLRDGVAVCQAGVRLWLRQCGAGETADSRAGAGPDLESEAHPVQPVRRDRTERRDQCELRSVLEGAGDSGGIGADEPDDSAAPRDV